jgi:hypothetical protein
MLRRLYSVEKRYVNLIEIYKNTSNPMMISGGFIGGCAGTMDFGRYCSRNNFKFNDRLDDRITDGILSCLYGCSIGGLIGYTYPISIAGFACYKIGYYYQTFNDTVDELNR